MAYPYYPQNFVNPYFNQNANFVQNNGFVTVRSEDEARNYPVAPGNSVTFRNEAEPFIYTKTMGNSQFDRPVFERYRLIKEQPENASKSADTTQAVDLSAYALKTDIDELRAEIEALKKPAKKEKTYE